MLCILIKTVIVMIQTVVTQKLFHPQRPEFLLSNI